MNKSELLELLKEIGDDQDINETIQGVKGLIKPFDATKLVLEDFTKLLQENATIKGYWTSEKDRAVSKGVNTFKENNLQKLIDEELKKKSNEGKTPEQIKLQELEDKLAQMEAEKTRATNKAIYTKTLTEKGLNVDLVDFIYNDDAELFNSNLEKLNNIITTQVNNGVNGKLQNNSYTPPNGDKLTTLSPIEEAFYSKNPELRPE